MEFQNEKKSIRMAKLILKKLNEELSPDEQAELECWLEKSKENQRVYNEFGDEHTADAVSKIQKYNVAEGIDKLNRYLPRKPIKLWLRIAASVAAIVGLIIGIYFINVSSDPETVSESLYSNDVSPGGKGATLTLANGQKIKLSETENGEIAKERGLSITKTADGQVVYNINVDHNSGTPSQQEKYNTLSTAKGETYVLVLPDKSKVWLNAASSLTYSTTLRGSASRAERLVKLDGEAYFEVSENKILPFVVESKGQKVEVLGTHFNIRNYMDESAVKTTLLEGSVRITPEVEKGKEQSVLLRPGQQALLSAGTITVNEADTQDAIGWTKGAFVFAGEELTSIMRQLSRWYDVDVEYQNIPKNIRFDAIISRSKNLSEILQTIQMTEKVKFKIEGRKVIVTK